MRKIHTILILMTALAAQSVFADDASSMSANSSGDKPCHTIATACMAAGFVKTKATDKRLWQDCMKPIILGQTISGVTVDSTAIKSCRVYKIKKLKIELQEFQAVS